MYAIPCPSDAITILLPYRQAHNFHPQNKRSNASICRSIAKNVFGDDSVEIGRRVQTKIINLQTWYRRQAEQESATGGGKCLEDLPEDGEDWNHRMSVVRQYPYYERLLKMMINRNPSEPKKKWSGTQDVPEPSTSSRTSAGRAHPPSTMPPPSTPRRPITTSAGATPRLSPPKEGSRRVPTMDSQVRNSGRDPMKDLGSQWSSHDQGAELGNESDEDEPPKVDADGEDISGQLDESQRRRTGNPGGRRGGGPAGGVTRSSLKRGLPAPGEGEDSLTERLAKIAKSRDESSNERLDKQIELEKIKAAQEAKSDESRASFFENWMTKRAEEDERARRHASEEAEKFRIAQAKQAADMQKTMVDSMRETLGMFIQAFAPNQNKDGGASGSGGA
ncbi:hypothetical protein CBOM_04077 [Ceraceosorus bombacis]|uniref:Uncharacterized protein n=1 Tax=Ceraceosorus bombacis TaxID=401625 RepID=A0A0P1BMY6_9BASI|nr:hypothetical protein CBOM_04077 [Ceraceosorus bombacis]